MRHGFIISAGITVLIGCLAVIFYIESAATPGEQCARVYGCMLCHPGLFDTPLPGLAEQHQHGAPLHPLITRSLQKAHRHLAEDAARSIADYALSRQQQALARLRKGDQAQAIYLAKCAACHGPQGEGQDDRYPPLHGSEWITADPSRLQEILHQGLQGPITVRGKEWNETMLPPGIAPGEETDTLIRYLRQTFAQ